MKKLTANQKQSAVQLFTSRVLTDKLVHILSGWLESQAELELRGLYTASVATCLTRFVETHRSEIEACPLSAVGRLIVNRNLFPARQYEGESIGAEELAQVGCAGNVQED